MTKKRRVMQCSQCGNRTAFDMKGFYYSSEPEPSSDGLERYREWCFWECLSCSKPTLIVKWQVQDLEAERDEDLVIAGPFEEVIYPMTKSTTEYLPEAVAKAYGEAMKVHHVSPSACAVMIGRMLEAVCNHKQVAGKTLADKLRNLASSESMPPQLGQMAQQLRVIRNLGAHAAEDEVTEEDVPIVLDFAGAILEYVYVAPAKIAAVEERLSRSITSSTRDKPARS